MYYFIIYFTTLYSFIYNQHTHHTHEHTPYSAETALANIYIHKELNIKHLCS